jgi:hypothetical protein
MITILLGSTTNIIFKIDSKPGTSDSMSAILATWEVQTKAEVENTQIIGG